MNQTKDPLTIKGPIERITLLPLNYTRSNGIIVYKWTFCRIVEQGNQSESRNRIIKES